MSAVCPAGHVSSTDDYCDQCGARIAGAVAVAAAAPPAPAAAPDEDVDTSTTHVAAPCPACGAPRSGGDRYCEDCGYDFVAAPPVATAGVAWTAVVEADRAVFDRIAPEGLAFPADVAPRTIDLDRDELTIGRTVADLTGAGDDPAISRLHARLVRQDDGSYAVVDEDSSNGTTVNGGGAPIAPHVVVPLADGDRIHVGAWTTITVRLRSPAA